MNTVTITGVDGSLYWGYLPVGTVRGWTATRAGNTRTLTATIAKADAFRLSQRPLIFVVTYANGEWRWPLETVSISNRTLTATVGESR